MPPQTETTRSGVAVLRQPDHPSRGGSVEPGPAMPLHPRVNSRSPLGAHMDLDPLTSSATPSLTGKAIAGYIERNSEDFSNLEFFEKGIEIALGDGVTVVGRIDLVKRIDTGEITVVDLKSSERAQAEDVTETQLHIYALGYQELTGRDADYVEIYELDEQKAKIRSVDEEFIADVKRDVGKAAVALRRNTLEPRPQPRSCSACDYRNLCSAAVRE